MPSDNVTFDNINLTINLAVIIPDPRRAVYIGSKPPHPQNITGSCPFIIISLVFHFSPLNGYSFLSNLISHTTDIVALNC